MTTPLLTIAIPTYNRSAHLERRLQELIPQVQAHEGVALCVYDDGSTDDTPQVVERYRLQLSIHERCPVNLGLGRNLLRAFESVAGGWLWTLGDDDAVVPDAVAIALELIRQTPDALAVNCHSEGGTNLQDCKVTGLPQYLTKKDIADILFMSSNLYNIPVLRPHLKVFCQALGTLSPHLALLLAALESSGRPLSFSTRRLTLERHWEQRWSSLEAAWGIASMVLFIKDLETQRLVACSARRNTRWMLRYGLREVGDAAGYLRWQRYVWAVNHLLASHGAGWFTDLSSPRNGDSWLLRLAPTLFSRLPYGMVKGRAMRLRNEHKGDEVLLDNSAIVPPQI